MDRDEIGSYVFSKVMNIIQNMPEYHDKEAINEALREIRRIYSSALLDSTPTLFQDSAKRVAYMYLYFTGICAATKLYWLNTYNCLDSVKRSQIDMVIRKWDISVCSIGGGPATDVIAFHSFLCSLGLSGATNARVLDAAIEWRYIANRLISDCNVGAKRQLKCDFTYFNFSQNFNDSYATMQLKTADVVSIVKFFSAVNNVPRRYQMLQQMIAEMKPGSLLFVMDNFGDKIQSLLKGVFQNAGFTCLIWNSEVDTTITINQPYNPDFECKPQRRVKVFATLWRKNSSTYSPISYRRSGVSGIDPASVTLNRPRSAIASHSRTSIRSSPYPYELRTQQTQSYGYQSHSQYRYNQPTSNIQSSLYRQQQQSYDSGGNCCVLF